MASAWTTWLILMAVAVVNRAEYIELVPGVEYENCGPPFQVTVSPNPPTAQQPITISLQLVAAHDLIAGVMEAYMNVWPYHYKDVYCDGGRTVDPKGCFVTKGEKRVLSETVWIEDAYRGTYYEGNFTLRNEDGDLMICLSARGRL